MNYFTGSKPHLFPFHHSGTTNQYASTKNNEFLNQS